MTVAHALPLADWWGRHGDVGAGWMILMMTVMVLFWGAIIFGVVWLIRGATQGGSGPPESRATRETPVEILERRFAEGAISPEDYRARRQVLLDRTAESTGGRKDEPLRAPQAAEGRK